MTHFSFEVPHAHLEDFDDLQDFHFILSIHCRYKWYRDYYINKSQQDFRRIWLDNGFNEKGKADTASILARYFVTIGADKVIAPDSTGWGSTKLLASFYRMGQYIPSNKIIIVANHPIVVDMAYMRNIRNIAIPFRTRIAWPKEGYEDRLVGHHFLGLNSINEIKQFKPSSLDTSLPIRLAMNRMSIREWHEKGCPREGLWFKDNPYYFETKLSTAVIDMARHNIITLKEVGK